MKHMKLIQLAWLIGALVLGNLMTTTAQADPIASAEAIVTFENFTINWTTANRQAAVADFTSLSVTSSLLTAANMTGFAGISMNPSSANGSPLVAESVLGTVDPSITGLPGATTTTVFNAPTLPLTGNFSASGSNEVGSPILNFFSSTSPANLHNASYASLDTLAGTAGTSTSSQLASTATFVAAVGGDTLTFNFDLGKYIADFLSLGAEQTASSSWSVGFNLVDITSNTLAGFFAIGDNQSNNAPGTGTTLLGALNSSLTGTTVNTNAFSFTTLPIVAGDTYQLTATISTRAQVERVSAVPEPATLSLLGIGLLGLGLAYRRTQKTNR